MPRLPNLTNRADVPEELLGAYDRVAEQRNGTVSGPYGVLLHSEEVAVRGATLGSYVRFQSALTPAQREVAILTAARELNAAVMWAGHVQLARDAGVSARTIETIANRHDPATASEEEAEIIRYVRELHREHRISDETFEALHARLGDKGIVDLTGLVGYYGFVGAVLNAFEVEAPEGAPRLP